MNKDIVRSHLEATHGLKGVTGHASEAGSGSLVQRTSTVPQTSTHDVLWKVRKGSGIRYWACGG